MRRIAAHYIYWKKLLPLHYIEQDDSGRFCGIFPLNEEIAGTEFWDGVVYPLPAGCLTTNAPETLESLQGSGITDSVEIGTEVVLRRIS